jgi:DNA invertase Pin-like site-specific DNA recombinase
LIIERTRAGVEAARARGRVGGRPKVLSPARVQRAIELIDGGASLRAAAREIKTSHVTLRRYIKSDDVAKGPG